MKSILQVFRKINPWHFYPYGLMILIALLMTLGICWAIESLEKKPDPRIFRAYPVRG